MSRKLSELEKPVQRRKIFRKPFFGQDTIGRVSEAIARGMGTGFFLIGMSLVVAVWLTWNTLAPVSAQFDSRALNFTLLTLILSLQASYAAPLILLAQNREADRDRVKFEQDRQRAERNLADTEYLAREVVALRLALQEVATKDFVRDELKDMLSQLTAEINNDQPSKKRTK